MENASKALIIAAEALIAILLLTLFAYMYTSMSESSENLDNQIESAKITSYNQQFLIYDGRGSVPTDIDTFGDPVIRPLIVQEVATIINMAIDSNQRHEFDNTIAVWMNGTQIVDQNTGYGYAEIFLNNYFDTDNKYTCSVSINPETQLVNRIDFNNC